MISQGVHYGDPLRGVTGRITDQKPKLAIIFIIDGCRADTLYNALDNGEMPKLQKMIDDIGGYTRYDNCFTVFPSVTITCHASIITGAYPGYHGIVGNDWFIRKKWGSNPGRDELFKVTREYVKYSWKHPFSDPGLANGFFAGNFFGTANSDMYQQVKTIYEAYNDFISQDHESDRSMSIFEMITRGSDNKKFIDFDDISGMGGRILGIINWARSKFSKKLYLSFPNNGLDCRAFEELLDILDERERKRPELFTVWLPGMDGFSHKNGASNQPEYFKDKGKMVELFVGDIDEQFGKLGHRLKKEKLLQDVIIAITADHGQYDCSDRLGISNEMLYHYMKFDKNISEGETFPLTDYGKVDNNSKDASVIVIGNGGTCYIYLKSEDGGWSNTPKIGRMEKFFEPLKKFIGTDKVFVRVSDNEYKLWDNGELHAIDTLDTNDYPFAKERVNNLANTMRSGDIILSTKKPFYYASEPMRGEHGSLHREDSHVPLLFINSALAGTHISDNSRTIDIAPTIADTMGFLQFLQVAGGFKDKLSAILDALENRHESKVYQVGLENTLKKMESFSEENRIRREWDVEEDDMRNNFDIKVRTYLHGGKINKDEHDELVARYNKIIQV